MDDEIKKQRIAITGAPSFGPDVSPRLPIKDLITNERQFSLYVQALTVLQQKSWNADDQLSFWQLGAIHGDPTKGKARQPYIWDTVSKGGSYWCAHGTRTFTTWHRVYVVLFEQALVEAAIKIVDEYRNPVDPALWRQAAQTLRAPYWDWAVDVYPPDEVIAREQLAILDLNDRYRTVSNPLFSFTYPPGSIIVDRFPRTVRHPDQNGKTVVKDIRSALQGAINPSRGQSMRDRVFRIHRDIPDWDRFSSDTSKMGKGGFTANGIEQPHNEIHPALGGNGALGSNPAAGFDPAFMLHHSNVDRHLALWSTYHNQWISNSEGSGNLTPFWDGKAEFLSINIRDTKSFKYTYPEFVGIPDDATKASAFIWRKIVDLYGPKSGSWSDSASSSFEWFAHVKSPVGAIDTTWSVYFFLGQPPESPSDWHNAENLLGTYVKFTGFNLQECTNCRELSEEGAEAQGAVSLSPGLQAEGKHDLSDEDIDQYLRDNLEWRAKKVDGTIIDLAQVDGLQISVVHQKLTRPEDDEFPAYPGIPTGEPVYRNVTEGKPGGRPNA